MNWDRISGNWKQLEGKVKEKWGKLTDDDLTFAGGKVRFGVDGSLLGVHRFVATSQASDPVADTQRTAGLVLGYFTKMGVSSLVVEAMSQTREVRWLDPKEAVAMNLITDPIDRPAAASR